MTDGSDNGEIEPEGDNYFGFSDELADICKAAAGVFLGRGLQSRDAESEPVPVLVSTNDEPFKDSIGSDEPTNWISECVSVYLAEAANELLAIEVLLRSRVVAASLDPLVRAIIERTGVVNWLLDEKAQPRQRSIRGSLAWIVSVQA